MLETSARLLRLLSLFQGRRYWSGPDLSGRLEVTSRTLRRDVDKLRTLGYPIHSTSGAEGGYQLGAGMSMPPLLLDDEEAVAVAMGLRYAATGSIDGVEEASMRALLKIEQILPPRLARRVAALQSVVVSPGGPGAAVDARTLFTIASACREREMLRFRYRDKTGAASGRSVEPHRVVNTWRRWYLVAWDTVREDWRTFRVDRMERCATAPGVHFVPREPPARDLSAYATQSGVSARSRARLKLAAPAASVAEWLPPFLGLVEPIDARSCFLEAGSSSYQSLAVQLSMIGVDFEILEPAELVEEVRRLAERYQRAIGVQSAPDEN
jgi:predicted DNA-binding transcriptional regulator YafY